MIRFLYSVYIHTRRPTFVPIPRKRLPIFFLRVIRIVVVLGVHDAYPALEVVLRGEVVTEMTLAEGGLEVVIGSQITKWSSGLYTLVCEGAESAQNHSKKVANMSKAAPMRRYRPTLRIHW